MTLDLTISIPDLYTDLATRVFASPEGSADRVGIEAEFFLLRPAGSGPEFEQVSNGAEELRLFDWLDLLATEDRWERSADSSEVAPEWQARSGSRITLEPGGQIEISSPPYAGVDEALAEVDRIERIASEHAASHGLLFLPTGYNDRLGDNPPELVVRKPRYLLMDEHFSKVGPWGRMMMRATCSTQVNLDFGPRDIAMKRWRLAIYLSQVIGILYSTSRQVWEGESFANFRREIWRRTDPCRTGVPVGVSGSDPVSAYLDFALDATVIFVEDPTSGCRPPSRPVTFRQWLSGSDAILGRPNMNDWETHLSTLFPDVRPRGFIEIRTLDAMPSKMRGEAVRTLVRALYSDAHIDELLDIFESDRRPGEDSLRLRRSLSGLLRSA